MKLNPAGRPMCHRPDRDERGRLLPGSTANPRGRPPVSRYARLLAAADAAGASVIICLPPRLANDDRGPTNLPPVVA
jgi:hypothetical protein